MKKMALFIVVCAAAHAFAADAKVVSRTTTAINFGRAGSTKLALSGTSLMKGAYGELKVQSKPGRIEVELKAEALQPATSFGLEYLTYVVWAVSPQGRADNLGELVLDHSASGKVKATTELQTFGVLVTAEPYFAVTQPSSLVVMETAADPAAGAQQAIQFSYELLGRDAYSSSNQKIDNAIFGIDSNTPLALFEARNALRIARSANADKYSADAFSKAQQSLQQAETAYRQKLNKSVITYARDAAQNAEDARVMALKKQEQDRLTREAADREAKARADAAAETQRRHQAEEDRAKAEQAKAEAERMRKEAEDAAAQAAEEKAQAEQAKAEAEQAQAAAAAETAQAKAQQQALAEQAEKSRQAADQAERARQQSEQQREQDRQQAEQQRIQAEKEKADLRAKLLQQLNSILETKDTARGLIANMGDVLFQTGKYELKPEARERLAKVSGILLAYPTLKVAIEGHTDSVGTDDYNQRLSDQRAHTVRDYFVQQGVSAGSITAQGFGKTQPIADNMTADGRQRNRRVELVLSGEAIGESTKTSAQNHGAPTAQ
jgi:outer membrane protein OmpA-like peptidoglycan-associated protein